MSKQTYNKRDEPTCLNYGKLGHVIYKCYKLHSFPPGFKFTNKDKSQYSSANQVFQMDNTKFTTSDPAFQFNKE